MSVKLEYDKNGREVLRKFGNGTKEETLYDKAGRVTVKLQKNERNELLWAEGYVYGDDGKRTATVDNKGLVTLYEYNRKGQIQNVYYPYSQEIINNLKKEAEENGLPTNTDISENRYLPAEIKSGLIPLLNSMQYGLAYSLPNMQIFVKESYSYDKNGNRTGKTTKYGTINYSYDKENRLVSSGSRGRAFINYTYDNAGNLLTEESANKTTKYAYNALNRLIYCEVTDKSEKTYAQTTYAYDAFGRRVIVQDKGEAAVRTLYDGFTFDVIKQSSTLANGFFTDSNNTGIRWSPTGKPTGDRYRYISDEEAQDDNRYFYLDENTYKTVNSRYRGERTQISVNGSLAAQASSEGEQYFTTDLLGSVTSVTDSYGSQKNSYTYDAFGSIIHGELTGSSDFGYLGKQNDPSSKLYDYGFRDYKPEAARFTTVDPIRDGTNWFLYVSNDPVNNIDILGLCESNDTGYKIKAIEGKNVITVGIKNPYAFEDAANDYFAVLKYGTAGNIKVDSIALTGSSGEILHNFSNDEAIKQYASTIIPTKGNLSETMNMISSITGIGSHLLDSSGLGRISAVTGFVSMGLDIKKYHNEKTLSNKLDIYIDIIGFAGGGAAASLIISETKDVAEQAILIENEYKKKEILNKFSKSENTRIDYEQIFINGLKQMAHDILRGQ